ncbi:DUF262 domain-containing protein [Burkholderia cenocepacia]|uniref:DUF262 domain-containing protein n=1 Tax=Burkholderia cenocepacia TaxID=95486 RepID=UPI000981F931|nr:DUF262 domain-containing protein [Burkholderia cenocepacia]ONS59884.1 hypothetical protein A8E27_15855 [Burkholderia cenocepacia]
MTIPTIESQDLTIAGVLQSFYVVPDYQREYVWETDQVEQLLGDIFGELGSRDAGSAPEYFIGSIVVCLGHSGVLELIDGQQRMTTLYVTLCAVRDHLKKLGQNPPGALEPQIAATSTDASGQDHFRYRLDLQYEDSGDMLQRLATGDSDKRPSGQLTRSMANIYNAYQVARSFLHREFGESADETRGFYGYLTNRVKLIRIQTQDVAKALKVFETINDRGVGLDSMDLLKNLLFMKANRDQFEKLKVTWKELQDTIFAMGEKPLRFLRYFIFSSYDVDVLREDEIYGWLTKNEAVCGYAKNPLGFAKELVSSASAYRHFLLGKDQDGNANRFLGNIQCLGGKAARQHLILLLAGRHLSGDLFDRLCQEVENLFFCYVVTREPTRDFERDFARWAAELRCVQTSEQFEAFVAIRFAGARTGLSSRFYDAIRRLTSDSVQKYRLRYILAKLTQFIELEAYGETEGTRWLSRYISGGYEIEHILPENPSSEAVSEFGDGDLNELAQRLGNLVLAEKSINASLGNRPYSKKRPVYLQSQLLLTRSLSERPKIGSSTRIDLAVAELDPFDSWSAAAIERRQMLLADLARRTWDVI